MQWLKLVSEDTGIQKLKADNRLPAKATGVDPVPPYPASHPASIGEQPLKTRGKPVADRRRGDRRKGDRRKKQVPVVLDTRSKHDRRTNESRRKSDSSGEKRPSTRRGINLLA